MATHKNLADVVAWLKERRNNAIVISAGKKGADRDGWIDDAEFFQAAIDALESTLEHLKAPQVQVVSVPLPDLPEPRGWLNVDDWTPIGQGYTADQMCAYACQYALAHKAKRAEVLPDDIHRIDYLESLMRHYGYGMTEPKESTLFFGWVQTSEQPDFPGLRAAIDSQRSSVGRADALAVVTDAGSKPAAATRDEAERDGR